MRDTPKRLVVVVAIAVPLAVEAAGCGIHHGASGARDSAPGAGCSQDLPPITEPASGARTVRGQFPPMPMKIEPVGEALVGKPPFMKEVDGLPAQGMHHVGDIAEHGPEIQRLGHRVEQAAQAVDSFAPQCFAVHD